MATLRNGSQGDDVRKLQESLNQAGYKLDVDGVYGNQTQAAVRDYQSKNGLTVDGIAGNNTLSALAKASASAQAPAQTQPKTQTPTQASAQASQAPQSAPRLTGVSEYTHSKISGLENGYQPSERVQQAMAYLDEAQKNPVAEYQSPYDAQIQDAYQKIVGREPFSYSLTGDMLYQQYKQEAVNNGRLAMRDSMGQAAALNGGYGSSYGQAVGQQSYNQYLQNLNDVVPDLYNAAYQRWLGEGDDLMQQYQMLRDQENQDYARWNDQYNRYQTELDRAQRNYESERDFDYNTQLTEREYWNQRAQAEQEDYLRNLAAQASASGGRSGGGSGSGGGRGGKKSSTGKEPTDEIWADAAKIVTDSDAEAFIDHLEQSGYNTDDVAAYLYNKGVQNGVIFRNDYTTTEGDPYSSETGKGDKVEAEILQQIAQKKADPSSSSLSLAQLEAELQALRENRIYMTLPQYNEQYNSYRKRNVYGY